MPYKEVTETRVKLMISLGLAYYTMADEQSTIVSELGTV